MGGRQIVVVGMERWGGRRHRAGLAMEKAQCKEKKKGWNKKKSSMQLV